MHCSSLRILLFVLFIATILPRLGGAEDIHSAWVYPGPDGKLAYHATPAGDRIMDFSYAGYHGGGVALPNVPVKLTVQPSGTDDDTATIQSAIDQVASLPSQNGFRGAVRLGPGIFHCSKPLIISASGVVLRGSGSTGENRSTIKLTGAPHNAITVESGRRSRGDNRGEAGAPRTTITDAYVPSGTNSFAVASTEGFAVGDVIVVHRPVTAAWVKFMGMDDLTRDNKPQTWIRAGSETTTERRIAAIDGNKFTLDEPLTDSFDAKYLNPPGVSVVKITPSARLREVGIEDLHIESPLQEISHTQAHFSAVRLTGEDCWMRAVAIEETMNSVGVGGRRITLQRVSVYRKAKHQGASKPAEFAPNGGEVLLDRCSVVADNVWFVATGAGQAGPIVVLNCTFLGNGHSEAHQRWSTGMLYDNCRAPDGGFDVRNRGEMGSGHGWAMGWGVIWNCTAKTFLIQNPPGAANWLIGSTGQRDQSARPFGAGALLPEGIVDSPDVPVAPRSLYLTQLAERLGPSALKALGYPSADPASAPLENLAALASAAPAVSAASVSDLGVDLALDRPVLTSDVRSGKRDFAGWQALDNNDQTYWATNDGTKSATLEIDTEGAIEINALALGEAAGLTGQVKAYRVEGFVDSAWKVLSEGTTIGELKVERFPIAKVWKVRLTVLQADPFAAIRKFGLYLEKVGTGGPPVRERKCGRGALTPQNRSAG